MAQITTKVYEREVKCLAVDYFNIFTSNVLLIVEKTICGEKVVKIEVLNGSCTTVGSCKRWEYVFDPAANPKKSVWSKEKLDAIDVTNLSLTFVVTEGDVLEYYKSYKASLQVTAKGTSCSVKWTMEYEKKDKNTSDYENFLACCHDDIVVYLEKP